jgi:hypothetical protein
MPANETNALAVSGARHHGGRQNQQNHLTAENAEKTKTLNRKERHAR